MSMKFQPGAIVATQGVMALALPVEEMVELLRRHLTGDWGDVCAVDARANDTAVEQGFRILSSYQVAGVTIWLITEWDRSVTTYLLPEEY